MEGKERKGKGKGGMEGENKKGGERERGDYDWHSSFSISTVQM